MLMRRNQQVPFPFRGSMVGWRRETKKRMYCRQGRVELEMGVE